jgi:hypothetical protein
MSLRDYCVFGCALLCSVVPNATGATRILLIKSKLNFHRASYEPGGSGVRISPGAPINQTLAASSSAQLIERSENVAEFAARDSSTHSNAVQLVCGVLCGRRLRLRIFGIGASSDANYCQSIKVIIRSFARAAPRQCSSNHSKRPTNQCEELATASDRSAQTVGRR